MENKPVIKRKGLYIYYDGDARRHLDIKRYEELEQAIPDYFEDECPVCGNKENLQACRCAVNHRYCSCGTVWHWEVNKQEGRLEIILEENKK